MTALQRRASNTQPYDYAPDSLPLHHHSWSSNGEVDGWGWGHHSNLFKGGFIQAITMPSLSSPTHQARPFPLRNPIIYRFGVKILEVPAPTDHGWALSEDILEPVWSEGPVLPSKVVDILDSDMNIDDQQDNKEDSDLNGPDFQCTFSSDEGSGSDS